MIGKVFLIFITKEEIKSFSKVTFSELEKIIMGIQSGINGNIIADNDLVAIEMNLQDLQGQQYNGG